MLLRTILCALVITSIGLASIAGRIADVHANEPTNLGCEVKGSLQIGGSAGFFDAASY